jgi:hypothetical protein
MFPGALAEGEELGSNILHLETLDNVRFAPESRHCSAPMACPLSAISGCEQSQQGSPYSITS